MRSSTTWSWPTTSPRRYAHSDRGSRSTVRAFGRCAARGAQAAARVREARRGLFARDRLDADLRFLVESLIRIVRPLDIRLIASNVEDPGLLEQLSMLGFDGFQGFAGDRPGPL